MSRNYGFNKRRERIAFMDENGSGLIVIESLERGKERESGSSLIYLFILRKCESVVDFSFNSIQSHIVGLGWASTFGTKLNLVKLFSFFT